MLLLLLAPVGVFEAGWPTFYAKERFDLFAGLHLSQKMHPSICYCIVLRKESKSRFLLYYATAKDIEMKKCHVLRFQTWLREM